MLIPLKKKYRVAKHSGISGKGGSNSTKKPVSLWAALSEQAKKLRRKEKD